MSKPRNTSSAPRRGRHTALAASALVAGSLAAGLLTACSSDAHNPTEPAAAAKSPTAYYGSYSGSYSAPYNSTDASKQLTLTQFNSQLLSFVTQSGDRQAGTRLPELMSCNSWTASSASASVYVTPTSSTTTIQIGRIGTLTIPAGAARAGVQITASATLGTNGVKFDFLPHGTTFAKPLSFTANYQGCSTRFSSPLNVFYVNDQGGVLQTMPSTDDRANSTIKALTDHFSGFMVAWT